MSGSSRSCDACVAPTVRRRRRRNYNLAALAVLLFSSLAGAEPVVTLPLDGYYRPGKFFPVKIESDRDVTVEVTADAISSRGRGRSMVLPAMSLSRVPGVVKVTIDGKTTELPIRPLEAGQKLTLTLGPTMATEGIRVALPNAKPWDLNQAYESADVVISPDADEQPMLPLRAAGVAVVTDPADVVAPRRGPTSSLDDGRPYNIPFAPSRDIAIRGTTFLMVAMFAILVLGLSLWRSRHAWKGVCVLSLAAVAVGAYRWHTSHPVSSRYAGITFAEGSDVYRDEWVLAAALEDTDEAFAVRDRLMCRPIFAGQAQKLAMVIEVTPEAWVYHYRLPRQSKIAFVSRSGAKSTVAAQSPETGGDFRDMMRSYYVRPGERLQSGLIRDPGGYETYWITPAK